MTRKAATSNVLTESDKAASLARESLRRQKWASAFSQLSRIDRVSSLPPIDLEGMAEAAHLLGKENECVDLLERAHQGFLGTGETRRAVQCAYRMGFMAMINEDMAQAGGWFARAGRLLENEPDCAERGYLLLPVGYRELHGGDASVAFDAFSRAVVIGQQFEDVDLTVLARQGQGRALIRQGEIGRGVSLLDEAMVAVRADQVSAITAGNVYCSVIDACGEIFDLRRAQEWTTALERWCALRPDIVPYRSHCLVRRSELLQSQGSWVEALHEAKRACERLSQPTPRRALGSALYRMAELHRLRGNHSEAEAFYRQANTWQRVPQPGLARLRFAQGKLEAAEFAIRQVAEESLGASSRPGVLEAFVEIVLATDDVGAARQAAEELAGIAQRLGAPVLQAMSAAATGAVLLAEGEASEALGKLRHALNSWRELEAPYECARVRVLIARACRLLNDSESAGLELELARETFTNLGALPDLARLQQKDLVKTTITSSSLSGREVEVLRLVASGKTNRVIAGELDISEKTVARHVSNIFNKLDVSSRAAATAYAYRNQLA